MFSPAEAAQLAQPSTPIRILVTYVTAGAGHRRAAEAVTQAARTQLPEAEIRCVDALTHTSRRFHAFYASTYIFLVRHAPWVWRASYALLDWAPVYRLVQPLRRRWNLWICRPLTAWLRELQPDVIVTTHFLAADVCGAGKAAGWLTSALVVVVTDLFPHRFWIATEAEAFVVSTSEGREVLQRRGIAPERIHVQGIPIARAFVTAAGDRDTLRERLRLAPDRLAVLVTSGGTTVGQFERVVESLVGLEAALPRRLQLLVVCGEDGRTRRRLAERAGTFAMPVSVFGFTDHMAELMAVSDLIVTKAGGLTVSEALGRGIPIVLYHVIPGQERLNAHYLALHGAGIIAKRPRAVAQAVERLVGNPELLARMRATALALSRPDAAEQIVSQVVRPLVRR